MKKKTDAVEFGQRLAQELLFMRPFEFHTDATPEAVMDEIAALNGADPDADYEFERQAEREVQTFRLKKTRRGFLKNQFLFSEGRVLTHGGTGETIVRGRVQMQGWLLVLMLLGVGMALFNAGMSGFTGAIWFLLTFYVGAWGLTYRGRDELYQQLRERVYAAPAKTKTTTTNRLTDDATTSEARSDRDTVGKRAQSRR